MRLPKRILPIVERLRAEVPKPQGRLYVLTTMPCLDPCPRWAAASPTQEPRCPLGFHPAALSACPYAGVDFVNTAENSWYSVPDTNIKAFADWWDSLTLDKACKAVEEIWK